MAALRYNPLVFSEKLKVSGMSDETAKIIAQENAEMFYFIESVSKDSKKDTDAILMAIKTLELKMTIKFGTIMLIGVGLLNFLNKYS